MCGKFVFLLIGVAILSIAPVAGIAGESGFADVVVDRQATLDLLNQQYDGLRQSHPLVPNCEDEAVGWTEMVDPLEENCQPLEAVLGSDPASDRTYVSIPAGAVLVVGFLNEVAIDGVDEFGMPEPDLKVEEVGDPNAEGEGVEVLVSSVISTNELDFYHLDDIGVGDSTTELDFADVVDAEFSGNVRSVMFKSSGNGGVPYAPGFDLASVQALNFTPIPDQVGLVHEGPGDSIQVLLDDDRDGIADEIVDFGDWSVHQIVTGDWNGNGITGLAKVETVGAGTSSSHLSWELNEDHAQTSFETLTFGAGGDIPLSGDFDGDGTDELVVARNTGATTTFFIKYDRSDPNEVILAKPIVTGVYGLPPGVPRVGDWDGDGKAGIATVRGVAQCCYYATWRWNIDNDLDGSVDQVEFVGGGNQVPVVGDLDGDGFDDVGGLGPFSSYVSGWYFWTDTSTGFDVSIPYLGQSNPAPSDYPITGVW